MKNKIQTQFCLKVNEENAEMIIKLREKHAINLSKAFTLFLKDFLEKLENIK